MELSPTSIDDDPSMIHSISSSMSSSRGVTKTKVQSSYGGTSCFKGLVKATSPLSNLAMEVPRELVNLVKHAAIIDPH